MGGGTTRVGAERRRGVIHATAIRSSSRRARNAPCWVRWAGGARGFPAPRCPAACPARPMPSCGAPCGAGRGHRPGGGDWTRGGAWRKPETRNHACNRASAPAGRAAAAPGETRAGRGPLQARHKPGAPSRPATSEAGGAGPRNDHKSQPAANATGALHHRAACRASQGGPRNGPPTGRKRLHAKVERVSQALLARL